MRARVDPKLQSELDSALAAWDARDCTTRLWKGDSTLWTASGEERWLGWLGAVDIGLQSADDLMARVATAVPAGVTDVLLIGMGGSSLAPEVIARVVPARSDARAIHVLDSTHPAAVRDAFGAVEWNRTMIVVASKSGSTLEPDILLAATLDAAGAKLGADAAKHVIAITDPGSRLAVQAGERGFAAIVLGDPAIGGRFSALSPFGLVHVALRGLDVRAFLSSAKEMTDVCRASGAQNPGVQLGVFLATAARNGRDKCTLVLDRAFAPLGAWIEQLVAESTGKHGVAILPIDGESLTEPRFYGNDRAFVHVRDASAPVDRDAQESLDTLSAAGLPVFTVDAVSPSALAAEFFRWEFATSVAGALLKVNPFDQPDVEAAKVATRALTDAYERGDEPAAESAAAGDELSQLFATVRPGDYFGVLAFLPQRADIERQLQRTRNRVRDAKHCATTLGFGPRYLHSTGQAFKGGPRTGVFLQLTWDAPDDIPVPGRRVTFAQVVSAQAAGDRAVLRERGQRVVHVHLKGDLRRALDDLDAEVALALGQMRRSVKTPTPTESF